MPKDKLVKETIRFLKSDMDLIRMAFPGGYNQPGINEVIRSVIHSWVEAELRPKLEKHQDVKPLIDD